MAPPGRRKAPAVRRQSVAGVDVERAAPVVNVHEADPTAHVRQADPDVKVTTGRPRVDVHEVTVAEVAEEIATGADIIGGALTPAQMRRVVLLSEILRPPLGLRGPVA